MNSQIPPSSNPKDIYQTLSSAVDRKDSHCTKIQDIKQAMIGVAQKYHKNATIDAKVLKDITFILNKDDIANYSPLLYVIHGDKVRAAGKVEDVPANKRAGFGPEFLIRDLDASEFDILEF